MTGHPPIRRKPPRLAPLTCVGKHRLARPERLARETTTAQGICSRGLTLPPRGRAKTRKHATRATAANMPKGVTVMYSRQSPEHGTGVAANGILFICADTP